MGDPITTRQLHRAGKARAGTWLASGVLTLSVTGLLASLANWWEQDAIESDLTQRSIIALEEHGLSPDGVSFEGRDATLYGALAMKPSAIDAVQGVAGVHTVETGSTASNYRALTDSGGSNGGVSSALAGRTLSASALRAEINQLLLAHPIRFGPNSTELSPATRDTVGKLAALLQESPTARIEVAGHASGYSGASDSNVLAAAETRAVRVHDELVKRGVPDERVQANGYGDSDPKESEQASRRVEITVR